METPKVGEIWETEKGGKVTIKIEKYSPNNFGCDEDWRPTWLANGYPEPNKGLGTAETIYGRLVRRISPSPESTQPTGIGGDTVEPSPFWVRPEEREPLKCAMEMYLRFLETHPVMAIHESDSRPALNAVLDRFQDPKNQEAA